MATWLSTAHMNAFRILGDTSHTLSKIILITAIHRNRSAEGVSLVTQGLYFVVFIARYLDLFWTLPQSNWWNFVLKTLYIGSSAYLVVLMTAVFKRTREREYVRDLAVWALMGALMAAPLVCLLFEGRVYCNIIEIFWTSSVILESICVLPQLLLLRQTSIPTVLDSYYLVTLGSYRFFYILNWIYRAATEDSFEGALVTSAVFGIVQTALYVDFAWVYYSRQRVKLRRGGIVDGDDLRQGYLVKRFLQRRRVAGGGAHVLVDEEDEGDADVDGFGGEEGTLRAQESGRIAGGRRTWGPRGISVRADDTLPPEEGTEGFADARGAQEAASGNSVHFEDVEGGDRAGDSNHTPSAALEGREG